MIHPENPKLRLGTNGYHLFYCPGCKAPHGFSVAPDEAGVPAWEMHCINPLTLSPSLLVTARGDPEYRCHSFIRNGKIEFLNDCSHELAGQTVPLPDLPEWLRADSGGEDHE